MKTVEFITGTNLQGDLVALDLDEVVIPKTIFLRFLTGCSVLLTEFFLEPEMEQPVQHGDFRPASALDRAICPVGDIDLAVEWRP